MLAINLISAYNYSYTNFSLSDLLANIDSSTLLLTITFIISFTIIQFATARAFKQNKGVSVIISACFAFFITWGMNKTGFDLENLFYSIGFSGDFLSTILPILVLLGIALLIWKAKKASPFIIGLFLIFISFTEFIYSKGMTLLLGVGLIILGFFMNKKPATPATAH